MVNNRSNSILFLRPSKNEQQSIHSGGLICTHAKSTPLESPLCPSPDTADPPHQDTSSKDEPSTLGSTSKSLMPTATLKKKKKFTRGSVRKKKETPLETFTYFSGVLGMPPDSCSHSMGQLLGSCPSACPVSHMDTTLEDPWAAS